MRYAFYTYLPKGSAHGEGLMFLGVFLSDAPAALAEDIRAAIGVTTVTFFSVSC